MKRLINSAALWYIYYPQRWLLRIVGPHAAILMSRFTAHAHWLMALVGRRNLIHAIRPARDQFVHRQSIYGISRRYFIVKHQNFVEWHLYGTPRGRKFVQKHYRFVSGRELLDAEIRSSQRGVILLVYHFGSARMIFPALAAHGYETFQHRRVATTYAGKAYDWMAKAARDITLRSEQESGLNVLLHADDLSFTVILRKLLSGKMVGMMGDGMAGQDFVSVDFLNASMEFPAGPAVIAAHSGCPIVPVFCLPSGLFQRDIVIDRPVRCDDTSPASLEAATRKCARLLEQKVKEYPWAWWTWRRLRWQRDTEHQWSVTALLSPQELR